ncbi:MAG: hypothetical protein AAB414_04490 [Patescibacteria group bacterium]
MRREGGQTLLELILVITVIIFVVGALVFATISSLRNASFAQNQAQATKLAQEGIERVRTGRDRNQCINNLTAGGKTPMSWNGDNPNCTSTDSFWSTAINGNCGDNTTTFCYFKVDDQGVLTNIGTGDGQTVPSGGDVSNPPFKRAVIISDDSTTSKTITVIVTWIDFSGNHSSKLTTVLRQI